MIASPTPHPPQLRAPHSSQKSWGGLGGGGGKKEVYTPVSQVPARCYRYCQGPTRRPPGALDTHCLFPAISFPRLSPPRPGTQRGVQSL